jgi:hypothetical protein
MQDYSHNFKVLEPYDIPNSLTMIINVVKNL